MKTGAPPKQTQISQGFQFQHLPVHKPRLSRTTAQSRDKLVFSAAGEMSLPFLHVLWAFVSCLFSAPRLPAESRNSALFCLLYELTQSSLCWKNPAHRRCCETAAAASALDRDGNTSVLTQSPARAASAPGQGASSDSHPHRAPAGL